MKSIKKTAVITIKMAKNYKNDRHDKWIVQFFSSCPSQSKLITHILKFKMLKDAIGMKRNSKKEKSILHKNCSSQFNASPRK